MSEKMAYSDEPSPAKGVVGQLADDTAKGLDELDRLLHVLRSKLNPVIRETDPVSSSPSVVHEERGHSPLARQMQESFAKVNELQRYVVELTGELTV